MTQRSLAADYRRMAASGSRTAIAAMRDELERLVPACFQANRECCELDGIRTEWTLEDDFGGPCSSADIRAIEEHAKLPLPPSYRAFLASFGKRTGAAPEGGVLGPADFGTRRMAKLLDEASEVFDDEDRDPVAEGAIPFIVSELRSSVFLEGPPRPDGELRVVAYDLSDITSRSSDLVAYFRRELKAMRSMIRIRHKDTAAKSAAAKRGAAKRASAPKAKAKVGGAAVSLTGVKGAHAVLITGEWPKKLTSDIWSKPGAVLKLVDSVDQVPPMICACAKLKVGDKKGAWILLAVVRAAIATNAHPDPKIAAALTEFGDVLFTMKVPKASSYSGKAINPQRTQWDALVKTAIDRATKLGQRDRAARWTALSAKAEAVKLKTGR